MNMLTQKTRNRFFAAALGTALLAFGCGQGSGPGPGQVHQLSERVSDCGGFAKTRSDIRTEAPAYCDAEVLYWEYDEAAGMLKVKNTRVELNCCGDHGVAIGEDGGTIEITETDRPEGGGARCSCMCVFDFELSAEGIPAGTIPLRLVREVSDWPEGSGTVFEGNLDLAAGAGFVVISDQPSMWCQQP